jgi:hypothetical protein
MEKTSGRDSISGQRGFVQWSTAICLASLSISSVACEDFQTGPSLSAIAIEQALVSTTDNPSICCCRVTGTVTNNNDVAVHVTITWAAFENAQAVEPFARIVHFINDLQPSQVKSFDTLPEFNGPGASGFLVPCSAIGDLRREVDVNGLVFPTGS